MTAAAARHTAPSGEQYRITHGEAAVHVTGVGATLRSFQVAGVELLDGFAVDERASDGRGQVLAPWPNRIEDGRYAYGGHDVECPLTEPARHNAIHGLVRWLDWSLVELTTSTVTLACAVRPQPGYEWSLALEVTYRLDDSGLTAELAAVNTGSETAPFGAGFHPYLRLDGHRVDDLVLTVPAVQRVVPSEGGTTPEAVADTEWDFSRPRRVGAQALDTAYGGLVRGGDGRAVATLADPQLHNALQLWVDEAYRYLMVYTGDDVRDLERRRTAVAVEPMTCPPQAFRTGVDVIDLSPGDTWTGRWGVVPDLYGG